MTPRPRLREWIGRALRRRAMPQEVPAHVQPKSDLPRPLAEPGPVLSYLLRLHATRPRDARDAIEAVQTILRGPNGAILLDLLEKSTVFAVLPTSSEARALGARNAQGLIALDLRRIASDELERVLQHQDDKGPGRRRRRRNTA